MNPTLYDILGVSPTADRDEIKQAWREAADRFEPGSGGGSAQFRLFNEAAEVLLDPQRRRAYDEELAGRSAKSAAPAPATPASPAVTVPDPAVPGAASATATVDRAPADTDESPATPLPPVATDEGSTRRNVPTALLAVLGVLAAVAVGLAGYLGVEAQRAAAYQEALDRAPAAAERAAAAVLSYDFESLEADRDAAAKFLTDDYRSDYVTTFNELVQGNAEETQARVEAEVLASSAMAQGENRDPDRVPVLLFVNQTTVSTANEQPTVALNRVRFDMVNVDGTWLVDGITSY